jgi:D-alanyl-lipoteichoic acid acyltransferase DltB (MBOAT superfamily)
MPFNAFTFLVFLVVSAIGGILLSEKSRLWFLLAVSLGFYAFVEGSYVTLVVLLAYLGYYTSIQINRAESSERRTCWLVLGVGTCVAILCVYKSAIAFLHSLLPGEAIGWRLSGTLSQVILPLGISFYTFHVVSYIIDVSRGVARPEHHFHTFLLYVVFWPQLFAGPIVRAREFIPQIGRTPRKSLERSAGGFKKILSGLFLKIVLADQLAPFVDTAFRTDHMYLGGLDVVTMSFGFGLEIYFDFAGYSLIAIGSAELIGFALPHNFNWPYLASSPKEFWKRWHISLSSWARDYIYLPFLGSQPHGASTGGLDVEPPHRHTPIFTRACALLLTWVTVGLWHGISWNFLIWGLWHATLICAYRWLSDSSFASLPGSINLVGGWALTLLLVMLGWIPFRSETTQDMLGLLRRLLDWQSYTTLGFETNFYLIIGTLTLVMTVLGVIHQNSIALASHAWLRHAGEVVVMAVMLVLVFIFLQPVRQFIYFRF